MTDANVVLGYIPSGSLASGDLSVSTELAGAAVDRVAGALGVPAVEAARGIHQLANARMMRALRSVSSEKGRDPRDFALFAYGGSGPVHAAALAEELGVTTVIVPPTAGLFSSMGLLYAQVEFHDVRFATIDARDPDLELIAAEFGDMADSLAQAIGPRSSLDWVRSADVRYAGQSWDIEVNLPGTSLETTNIAGLIAAFESEHERQYGIRLEPTAPVQIRALRLAVRAGRATETNLLRPSEPYRRRMGARNADFGDAVGTVEAQVRSRDEIGGQTIDGPLLVDEYDTTVVVPPGWHAHVDEESACLVLERVGSDDAQRGSLAAVAAHDAITQQIIANASATVADDMAATIFRTAHSTVVRDALDYSTALCNPNGETVAQAVTIPFHLGSVPAVMETLLKRFGATMAVGDIFIMNDPFEGGIHTSDVFVVKPAYQADVLVGFAVTVAHHADIGGRLPGTTATDNTEIFQEGLRMPWVKLHDRGEPCTDILRIIEANVRIPRVTRGDLSAQVAACIVGERGLVNLAERYDSDRLAALFDGLLAYSESMVRAEFLSWPNGSVESVDYVDSDGFVVRDVPIRVSLTVRDDEVIVDLSESSPMVRGSLNTPRAFAQASVYQPIIAALKNDVPLNSGAFRPITVITKPGTITHVVMPAASSMRGVTGFRILDAVNRAVAQLVPARIPAAGEGGNTVVIISSNDLLGEPFILYELVVGTWGARPTSDGNDGLSNPSATAANIPIEVAEADFPVIIERYGLVQDSGGAGRYRGGVALERQWRLLVDEGSLQVRSDRQIHPPYGLSGGLPGTVSANRLIDADGTVESLPPMFSRTLARGSAFYHRTAGAGGWGDPLDRAPEAVARDVLNEKVSVAAAADLYGVIVTDECDVDLAATRAARARIRAARAG